MAEFNIESLPVKITYVCETQKDGWKCDQWHVEVSWLKQSGNGFYSTDYFTGLGLRRKAKQSWTKDSPVKPTISDVLYSLFMDASAADYNFNDWCSEYGYSDDSLKALNTYKQCLEIATNLRKAFDAETRKQIQSVIDEM